VIVKDESPTPSFVVFTGKTRDYITLRIQFFGELEKLLHEIGAEIILLSTFAPLMINGWRVARAA
jgi:hypothetical protein